LGMGAAGAFRAPMAIAVVGGVFSSTLLSLVVVPVVYTIIDDAVNLVVRIFVRTPVAVQSSQPAGTAGAGVQDGNGMPVTNGLSKHRSRWKWWDRRA